MTKFLKSFSLLLLSMAMLSSVMAQDLQSQRGESQDLGQILGHKVDRGGLVINPLPHDIVQMECDGVDISQGVKLVGEAKNYAEELNFLTEKNE